MTINSLNITNDDKHFLNITYDDKQFRYYQ